MSSTVQKLENLGAIHPPGYVAANIQYETIMGSFAYGVSSDNSDMDVYGFCVPSRSIVFPHLAGEIQGFGRQKQRFDQWQEHHVKHADKEYDLSIYSIVKYFSLCMENNPNMIDSLFTSRECVLFCTDIGNMVRDRRKDFLHKGSWHKFKGYAYSQMHKMGGKNPIGKRAKIRAEMGYDTKFAYHVLRLLDEAEQILTEGDIDLQRNREQLKAVRRGDVTEDEVRRIAFDKEHSLEAVYASSKLRHSPDEDSIKSLLLQCLEQHYGSLENCVVDEMAAIGAIRDISDRVSRYQWMLEK